MSRGPSPTVRRRRLAARLRELREKANLTIDEVGDRLECSASKISRIETGHVGVTPRDVRDMLEVYGVEDDEREALVQLAREARKKGWWHAYNEVFTGAFVGLESDASFLHTHQALLVPGLLQTEQYTRAVIRAIRPDAAETDVELRVRGRLNRQKLLTEESNPPEYWAVLDEAVLQRTVGGPEVMREQLKKLLEVASLPNVTLQVVPFRAGGHAGMEAPFLILGFPEQADPDVVYVEYSTSGVYLEQPDHVHRYTLMFDHLRAAALKPDDTLDLVDKAADRLS
jgi:transcriptional regulator with XRE-family HTH domain